MAIEHDDQRLTAYALDEMNDTERAEFEALLDDDAAGRASVDDIALMAQLLEQQFTTEEGPTLSAAQRAALEAEWTASGEASMGAEEGGGPTSGASAGARVVRGPWLAAGTMMALAAAVTLVINTGGELPSPHVTEQEQLNAKRDRRHDGAELKSAAAVDRRPPAAAQEAAMGQGSAPPAEPAAQPRQAVTLADEERASEDADPSREPAPQDLSAAKLASPPPAAAAPSMTAPSVAGPTGYRGGATGRAGTGKEPRVGSMSGADMSKRATNRKRAGAAGLAASGAAESLLAQKKRAKSKRASTQKPRKRPVRVPSPSKPPGFKGLADDEKGESSRREAPLDRRPVGDTAFKSVAAAPLSTFSADVDTASYSNVRKFLRRNILPPPASVRIEEMINYFQYDYAPPAANSDHPFAAHVEVAQAPWNAKHRLVRVGIKGKEIARQHRPSTNLVFLLDVSGSMGSRGKLPLLKYAIRLLTEQLGPDDRVAIVTYAGESGVALETTSVDSQGRRQIEAVVGGLTASGSTHGSDGLRLAYEQAVRGFAKGGINRVILASDGDFNVGITDRRKLERMITAKARSGVFLTVLGMGMGNYKDDTLEMLARKGNGNYAYLDNRREARKVLVDQLLGTLVTIAKDVKLQVEFNPAKASAYRLIGYDNRRLAARDFSDDSKDAGEIGAGHTVTALYEVVPAGVSVAGVKLKYAQPKVSAGASDELLTVKIRYKAPTGSKSALLEQPVVDEGKRLSDTHGDFQFAAAVGAFGMLLRNPAYVPGLQMSAVLEMARPGVGGDRRGHREDFLALVRQAMRLRR